ncbi:hypothetical protein OH76DRAFT_20956 [Lentinus brumalis]|uniref:Uncharacterized protein n=1 Tax=Lentinus brumalis TaxID=2498619 RepID=A0A371DXG7_9APHY|nr:hypothetical protein OH76DRAFT_20956 [Polyporus brumalis]
MVGVARSAEPVNLDACRVPDDHERASVEREDQGDSNKESSMWLFDNARQSVGPDRKIGRPISKRGCYPKPPRSTIARIHQSRRSSGCDLIRNAFSRRAARPTVTQHHRRCQGPGDPVSGFDPEGRCLCPLRSVGLPGRARTTGVQRTYLPDVLTVFDS